MTSCNKVVERSALSKNQAPDFSEARPYGTRYIRPRLQFLHCVTIIAAVNEWPLQQSSQDGQCTSGVGALRRGYCACKVEGHPWPRRADVLSSKAHMKEHAV